MCVLMASVDSFKIVMSRGKYLLLLSLLVHIYLQAKTYFHPLYGHEEEKYFTNLSCSALALFCI